MELCSANHLAYSSVNVLEWIVAYPVLACAVKLLCVPTIAVLMHALVYKGMCVCDRGTIDHSSGTTSTEVCRCRRHWTSYLGR